MNIKIKNKYIYKKKRKKKKKAVTYWEYCVLDNHKINIGFVKIGEKSISILGASASIFLQVRFKVNKMDNGLPNRKTVDASVYLRVSIYSSLYISWSFYSACHNVCRHRSIIHWIPWLQATNQWEYNIRVD